MIAKRLEKIVCLIGESEVLNETASLHYGDILLQQYRFAQLSRRERLAAEGWCENEIGKLHFPKRLMKLSLRKFKLDSDDISEIGKSLPNLEVLKLHDSVENWSADDEEFPRLKVLKITGGNWYKWDASEGSFPSLEQLWLQSCVSLKRIPLRFGDILCLRLISIKYCNLSVSEVSGCISSIAAVVKVNEVCCCHSFERYIQHIFNMNYLRQNCNFEKETVLGSNNPARRCERKGWCPIIVQKTIHRRT
ncbi:hypothetical protein Leryth_026412 [Lithospermum erythrorhizon]|nr:hypothetical protein Leryth_026412 [Lithospermum erythrorhizon]